VVSVEARSAVAARAALGNKSWVEQERRRYGDGVFSPAGVLMADLPEPRVQIIAMVP
jgi:hypothetical protein